VVIAAVVIAAVTDLRSFTIHNALTLPLLATGLIYHGLQGDWAAFSSSLQGAMFGFGILLPFFLAGGIGAGDVKLMAGVGAWLGWPVILVVFTIAALAGAAYGLVLVVACGRLREGCVNLQILWHRIAAVGRHIGAEDKIETEVQRDDRRRRLVPFGPMVLVAVITTLIWSRFLVTP
jgi:prepilin peptidase CpaA